MGKSLTLNLIDQGFNVSIFDIDKNKIETLYKSRPNNIIGSSTIKDFVTSLSIPRSIIIMVNAGSIIDEIIDNIIEYTSKGDVIIDGGNSYFLDTIKRFKYLETKGIKFLGVGISGGEKGARIGPSLMVGGSFDGWRIVKNKLEAISAKYEGKPCCEYIGNGGAGHFVKMVHNGIEYGIMEIISEIYDYMKRVLKLNQSEMSDIYSKWNNSYLGSYLINITSSILNKKTETGYLLDDILDKASQKGTGKWTALTAFDIGYPSTIINTSVSQRSLSYYKENRIKISELYQPNHIGKTVTIEILELTLYGTSLLTYIQGLEIIKLASDTYNWQINLGDVLKTWRAGCIIQASMLSIFERLDEHKSHLLLNDLIYTELNKTIAAIKSMINSSINSDLPIPAISAALNYFNSYRSKVLPANLIQAQRDYFGSHGYSKKSMGENRIFHTIWEDF